MAHLQLDNGAHRHFGDLKNVAIEKGSNIGSFRRRACYVTLSTCMLTNAIKEQQGAANGAYSSRSATSGVLGADSHPSAQGPSIGARFEHTQTWVWAQFSQEEPPHSPLARKKKATRRNVTQESNEDGPGFLNSTGMLNEGFKVGRNCCITPTFSGVPNKQGKIKSGYITLAFSGARAGWNCYVTPPFSCVPNKRDQK